MTSGLIWTIGTIELVLAALLVTVFVVLYGVTRPWWKSDIGRQALVERGAFMLVLWFATISAIAIHYGVLLPEWWTWVRLGTFGVVPVAFAWLLVVFVRRRVQRK